MEHAYLIAYDIADPRRLARVHRFLAGELLPLQFSVFAGMLSRGRLTSVVARLEVEIDPEEDDVRIYELPPACVRNVIGRDILPLEVRLSGMFATRYWRFREKGSRPDGA